MKRDTAIIVLQTLASRIQFLESSEVVQHIGAMPLLFYKALSVYLSARSSIATGDTDAAYEASTVLMDYFQVTKQRFEGVRGPAVVQLASEVLNSPSWPHSQPGSLIHVAPSHHEY